MNPDNLKKTLDSYAQAYDMLVTALEKYPEHMWQWKPAENKWSIHEVIVHIADSEANSYIRCRRLLAEPGSGVYGYDENAWARNLSYHEQPIEETLDLFRMLRWMSYRLILRTPADKLENAFIDHSENGRMSFYDWLRVYEEHIPIHIAQMERTYCAWEQRTEQ